MDVPLLIVLLRLVLAAVFGVAAVGKLADRPGSRQAIVAFGLPVALAPALALLLPLAEALTAVLLLVPATAWLGALGALGLLGAFIVGIVANLVRGERPDCHCFGQIHSAPAGPATLVRNLLLAAAAATVLTVGRDRPGPGLFDWASGMSGRELAGLTIGAATFAAVALLGWFTVRLAQSIGRLQLRIDELETGGGSPTGRTTGAAPTVRAGLPVGRAAPAFELDSVDGGRASLASLVGSQPLMLTFIDPGCAPCRSLLPDLARLQGRDDLRVVPISRGTAEENRKEHAKHRLAGVLLQQDREVAAAYEVAGTPSAVLIDTDGRIASPVAAGPAAIRELADRGPRRAGTEAHSREHAGHDHGGNDHDHGGRARPGLRLGDRVPSLSLPDLDGAAVDLAEMKGRDTVLLFWRPSCGYCSRMTDEVRSWAGGATGETRLVLIALDSAEANAAQGIGATTLLDPGMEAFGAFGATGTPVAVKVDRRGRVASPLASGTDQVRALVTAAGLAR